MSSEILVERREEGGKRIGRRWRCSRQILSVSNSISREYKSRSLRQGVSCLSENGTRGYTKGKGKRRPPLFAAVAASRRRGDERGGCQRLLSRTTCTNIGGRYVLSWTANQPLELHSTDLLLLVFSRLPVSDSLKVRSRVPIESCIKTTTRALSGIFFFRCQLSYSLWLNR